MNAQEHNQSNSKESRIQNALNAYNSKQYSSISKAARAFAVPTSTMQDRVRGGISQARAQESTQILSNAEENTLARWITRLTITGFPASPKLVLEMAEEIRRERVFLAPQASPGLLRLRPIGHNWLTRFKLRNPNISGIWTRQIANSRFKAATYEIIKPWFDAVAEISLEHHYPPECRYNMDESGFAIGASQSSRALVNLREKSSWKVIQGKQEWVTAIECVNAAGAVLPPLLIFKAKYTNSAWIPINAPLDWRFSTSNSGWTSDAHGFEWLTTIFEPNTRPEDPSQRRLLIMDGHSSHMTANFIAYCMKHLIDLLILPPHTSHLLQPLDVSVFAPLKRALAEETDRVARLDSNRISRTEWVSMLIRARSKALISSNILAGWRGAGLEPFQPQKVLRELPSRRTSTTLLPSTPQDSNELDLSLLDSSPPDGTELRNANQIFKSALQESADLPSPVRRYGERIIRAYEMAHSNITTMREELRQKDELLNARKKRKTGKRIAVEGKFVFTTEEVLQIVKNAEAATAAKKAHKQPRKRSIQEVLEDEEDELLENESSSSESGCIVLRPRR